MDLEYHFMLDIISANRKPCLEVLKKYAATQSYTRRRKTK